MAVILCTALLLLTVPGLAQAENKAKTDFINNFSQLISSNLKLQESIIENAKTNTVEISATLAMSDVEAVMQSGTKITNIPGSLDIKLAFNLKNSRANCSFKGVLDDTKIEGQIYLTDSGLVVTRDTIISLNALDESIFDLDDIDNLPEYIVFPIEDSDFDEFEAAFSEAYQQTPQKNDAIVAFLTELLNILPDSCYLSTNEGPALSLNLETLASQEFIDNLKKHSDTIIEKISEISGLTSTNKETKAEIAKDFEELDAQTMKDLLKEIPLTLDEFKVVCTPDQCKTTITLGISDGSDNGKVSLQGEAKVSSTQSTSKMVLTINADTSVFDMDAKADYDEVTNSTSTVANLILSGTIKDEEMKASGKIKGTIKADWSGKNTISVPTLTSQNSKVIEPKVEESTDEGITVYVDGAYLSFDDAAPMSINGRTMVPLRELAEYLGCQVEWQAPSTIKITGYDGTVTMTVNSSKYMEGSVEKQMDVAPLIKDGHTYVPIRFIGEYFDYQVEWDPEYQTVDLYSY